MYPVRYTTAAEAAEWEAEWESKRRGETLSLLREGWRAKLRTREYVRYSKQEMVAEELRERRAALAAERARAGSSAAGSSAFDTYVSDDEEEDDVNGDFGPAFDELPAGAAADDTLLPAPGALQRVGDYYRYNPIEVGTNH